MTHTRDKMRPFVHCRTLPDCAPSQRANMPAYHRDKDGATRPRISIEILKVEHGATVRHQRVRQRQFNLGTMMIVAKSCLRALTELCTRNCRHRNLSRPSSLTHEPDYHYGRKTQEPYDYARDAPPPYLGGFVPLVHLWHGLDLLYDPFRLGFGSPILVS